jgi:VanZ family protein
MALWSSVTDLLTRGLGWRRAIGWSLVGGYMALIFHLSAKAAIEVPPLFPHQDKVFHLCAYFGLAFLAAFATAAGPTRRRFLIAFSIAAVYGITDEWHQSYVPGRDASFWDWAADTAGGWLGAWTYIRGETMLRKPRDY